MDRENWLKSRQYTPQMLEQACEVLEEVRRGAPVDKALRRHPSPAGGYLAKHVLVAAYRTLVDSGDWQPDPAVLERIRMKPVRTLSGVTTVTVLTKPYPCPGKCIFCPTDVRMPKSYLPDEPGARRGVEHDFDPFGQVSSRLLALESVGHPTDKVELLILGGSWCAYRRNYHEWFIKRCFDAMNGQESQTLVEAQALNETAASRNVGLVIETRPTDIKPSELRWLRQLGVTKVQMGAQSLDDRLLQLNQRGHSLADTKYAVALLRAAGFKVVLHWMPNLLGATPESDRVDFARLWDDLCPDEIKIYPTQLLANAELYEYWRRGEYTPYTTEELICLIADLKPTIPRYCRVNRVVRDIPSDNVVEGNKRTSLRLDVQEELKRRGTACQCIRCREVGKQAVATDTLQLDDLVYTAGGAEEHFLSFVTPEDKLAGFLRLSLPGANAPSPDFSDLEDAAIIREVHVFGQSLAVGAEQDGAAQHAGLGTVLLQRAQEISLERGFKRLAVISAIGTRLYYLERGFSRGEFYLIKEVNNL
ncbi:MAG: tRNA uridine(34) 5-carboxymethylaminomethyl modification radical SAM/GNAT enzyme Elp3 [Anaerolineales bacterium]|nr:MAG: tRNA uridine(34) 5-carboxymethylaminomethyl modification radical SAM/GNAT enzyme Elp3 [Anaerolineales bacterium]